MISPIQTLFSYAFSYREYVLPDLNKKDRFDFFIVECKSTTKVKKKAFSHFIKCMHDKNTDHLYHMHSPQELTAYFAMLFFVVNPIVSISKASYQGLKIVFHIAQIFFSHIKENIFHPKQIFNLKNFQKRISQNLNPISDKLRILKLDIYWGWEMGLAAFYALCRFQSPRELYKMKQVMSKLEFNRNKRISYRNSCINRFCSLWNHETPISWRGKINILRKIFQERCAFYQLPCFQPIGRLNDIFIDQNTRKPIYRFEKKGKAFLSIEQFREAILEGNFLY